MTKCWILARNTFREAIRDHILYLIAVFALVVIIASKALGMISVERDAEFTSDFSLAALSLLALVSAIFVGTGLIYKELDKRTIYTILSKPVERWHFVVGKYLGLVATISLVVAGMELFLLGFLWVQGYLPEGDARRMLWYSLLLVHGEIIVLTAVAITLSLVTSPMLSAVLTLITWIAGSSSQEILRLAATLDEIGEDSGGSYGLLASGLRGFYQVVPHFEYFSEVKRYATWPDPERIAEITGLAVAGRMGYAVGYATVLLLVSIALFRRRSF